MNDIIEDDFELSNTENIGLIEMPNRDGFMLPDPRLMRSLFSSEPCMANCAVSTNIIGRARDIDVALKKKARSGKNAYYLCSNGCAISRFRHIALRQSLPKGQC